MLINQQAQYLGFIASYKNGNRFLPNTNEYNSILQLEQIYGATTKQLRENQGLNVPSLTYIEPTPTTTIPKTMATTTSLQPRGTTTGEQTFSVTTQPTTTTNLPTGLPAGTTTTNETFLSKYKMPLLIGGAALLGYILLKKK